MAPKATDKAKEEAKEDEEFAQERSAAKRIALAKAKKEQAAPPAKRAEHLSRAWPELADEAWVKGNAAAAARLCS